jgi:CCR4-NOT transcription complex subunit 1
MYKNLPNQAVTQRDWVFFFLASSLAFIMFSDSEDSDIKQKGRHFCVSLVISYLFLLFSDKHCHCLFFCPGQWFPVAQVVELCTNHIQSVSNDQIHEIAVFLHQSDCLLKHMDTFNNFVSLLKVKERPFFAPIPNWKFDSQSNPSRYSVSN